ncbi:MAG: prephenate dehydrogenase/arogenate dehydrogenase family protein [Gammaproteobacteria bacterium]|nr:prephenate dehydrogenase/arogenate dehydrogenase family protein [Gammaproteobacteria bacterium]
MINHLVIIGVGLIGSSLSLALKDSGNVNKVTGCGRSEKNLKKGVKLGVIDDYALDIAAAVKEADVIVVAVPLGAMREVFSQISTSLKPAAVITDVGSAKETVMQDASEILGDKVSRFVGGHPIAGTENSGVEAGFSSLYQERKVILTPAQDTDEDAVNVVENMWRACGAQVEHMEVHHHDMVLAATSHLPHMLAFSLVSHLSKMTDQDEIFNYAAGGFRDFTRIASSDPVMWRDICLANGDALVKLIQGYKEELDHIASAIQNNDPEALFDLFRDAKHTRDQLRHL